MAAADCSSGRRRFVLACGVLSRRVRAEAAAANIMSAAAAHACPAAVTAAAPTMLLMPGADVAPEVREQIQATPAGGAAHAQLTIMYGWRVLVFDGVPADRAAELVRVAAAAQDVPGGLAADMLVARKASLQRFMEKRRDRLGTRAPYTTARLAAAAYKKGTEEEADAGCWLELGLGVPGGCTR